MYYGAFRKPRAGAWNNLESGNLESGPRRKLIHYSSALIPIIGGARCAHRIVCILLICYGASREPRAGTWNNLESGNLESGPRRELIPHSSALIPIIGVLGALTECWVAVDVLLGIS